MARWLFRGPEHQAPDKNELAAFGLMWPEDEDTGLTIWPDNCDAVRVCSHLMTQWIMGPSGPVGFRYEALPVVLWGLDIKRKERRQVYHDVRIMEAAILECMSDGQ